MLCYTWSMPCSMWNGVVNPGSVHMISAQAMSLCKEWHRNHSWACIYHGSSRQSLNDACDAIFDVFSGHYHNREFVEQCTHSHSIAVHIVTTTKPVQLVAQLHKTCWTLWYLTNASKRQSCFALLASLLAFLQAPQIGILRQRPSGFRDFKIESSSATSGFSFCSFPRQQLCDCRIE